ncbi:hypothetical protein DFH09DRAFT_31040 [Mycena vulgaris]|nr:hypothetical protein DFH09DRAFT_31040 [Mycena vulgaris]
MRCSSKAGRSARAFSLFFLHFISLPVPALPLPTLAATPALYIFVSLLLLPSAPCPLRTPSCLPVEDRACPLMQCYQPTPSRTHTVPARALLDRLDAQGRTIGTPFHNHATLFRFPSSAPIGRFSMSRPSGAKMTFLHPCCRSSSPLAYAYMAGSNE